MSAYVVLLMNEVNSLEWLAAYQENVPALVMQYGGEYVAMSSGFRGEHIVCVDGAAKVPDAIGILRFPSVTHVSDFFASPAYQPYRAMRVAQTDSLAFAFAG
jgi:uncharacterized protein (DUF1330 family)